MRGLQGRVAVVTGALGDLGYAAAQRLREEGCTVALFDVLDATANQEKIARSGNSYWQLDISDESQVQSVCAASRSALGPASILVNSAACFVFKSIEATAADWAKITSVNICGTSLMAKYVVPQMQETGGGSIVNISSVSGCVGQANFATYNATKFAIRGLTKCWAHDLAQYGIRVNSVCPGYIYTSAFVNSCQALGLDLEEENRRASAMHLLNRQGKPEEVAAAIAFLASEEASFITGSDLVVDGGYLAR